VAATQLNAQREINKVLTERTGLLKQHAEQLSSQVMLASALQKAWEGASPKETVEHVQNLSKALADAMQKFDEAGASGSKSNAAVSKSVEKATSHVGKMSKAVDVLGGKWPRLAAGAAGFASGFVGGFKLVLNSARAVGGLLSSILGSILDIGLAIVMMPLRAFQSLIDVANKLKELMEAVARETENVRKQFGDISVGAGKAVIDGAKNVGKEWQNLGLGGYRIFGDLAQRIQHFNELATEMGPTFDTFKDELISSSGAAVLLGKGLGLSSEDMKTLAGRAAAFGTSLTHQLKEITKYSQAFSKATGVSAKLISRDMAFMAKDVAHFGNMGAKELAKVATYARKLNVETKELLGLIDQFDTFEGAATSAAMLSQAFGVQIDAMKMMNAKNPAEQIQMIRDAFNASGKSVENMSRQEMKYLSTMLKVDEEGLQRMLSSKQQAESMTKLNNVGAVAEKRQLTTAEAVEVLNKSIDRMIKSFREFPSFLSAFADGFSRGFHMAAPMHDLLVTIYHALKQTYIVGMAAGRAFATLIPDIGEVTNTLKTLFSIKEGGRFKVLLDGISSAFTKFFKAFAGGGKGSFKEFMNDIQTAFFNWFQPESKEGKQLQNSFKSFWTSMSNIFTEGVDFLADKLVSLLDVVVDFLTGKHNAVIAGTGSFVWNLITPIINKLRERWPDIKNALWKVISKAFSVVYNEIKPFVEKYWVLIGAVLFGPAMLKGILSAGMTAGAASIGQAVTAAITKSASSDAAQKTNDVVSSASDIAEKVNEFAGKGADVASKKSSILKSAVAVGATVLAIGAAVGAIIIMLKVIESKGGMPEMMTIAKLGAILLAFMPVIGITSLAVAGLGMIGFKKIASGVGGLALIIVGVGAAVGLMLWALSTIEIKPGTDKLIKAICTLLETTTKLLVPAAALTAMMGVYGFLFGAVGGGVFAKLGLFAKELVESAIPAITLIANTSIANPQQFVMVSQAVVGVLEAIAKFAKAINGIVGTVGITAIVGTQDFVKMISSVKNLVSEFISVGLTMTISAIEQLTASMQGKEKSLGPAATAVAAVITAISGFASSIADVLQSLPPLSYYDKIFGNSQEDFGIKIDKVKELVGTLSDKLLSTNFVESIKALVKRLDFGDLPIEKAKERIELFVSAVNAISSLTSTVGNLLNFDKEHKDWDKREEGKSSPLTRLFASASTLFGVNEKTTLMTAIDSITKNAPSKELFELANEKLTTTQSFANNISTMIDKWAEIDQKFGKDGKLKDIVDDKGNVLGKAISPAVAYIRQMVNEVNLIDEDLKTLSTDNIDVRLKALASNLGLAGDAFTIKAGNRVNLSVNVNVTVDAEELKTVLAKQGLVKDENKSFSKGRST
jgi:hypothetical protein